jgi:tRNA-2-methylthio-N6-dimethylallyladenosine synthase
MRLIRDIGYAQAFSFKYSPRPGTPGADLDAQVDEDVKTRGCTGCRHLLNEQQAFFMKSAGSKERTIPVLLEKPGRNTGQLVGRSPWLQPVVCDENVGKIGDIVDVRITQGIGQQPDRGKQGSGTDRLERKSQREPRQRPALPIWRISS